MNCYICGESKWHIRKDINFKREVGVCENCGNIAFIIREKDKKAIDVFYTSAYRQMPSTGNLTTTTRKLNYIRIFLKDYLEGKKGLICTDIGAATGYLPNFLRGLGHKATGTEKTTTFRRFSEHYYGVPLTESIEKKHKYDLITYYHVLEHLYDPDKSLMESRECLKDDGVIMISVPEWLHELTDLSAYGNLKIENYFHENHLNCFTRQSFKNLMAKCGLQIVKEDYEQYGITVLVSKIPAGTKAPALVKENVVDINKKIDRIKDAITLFKQSKTKLALEKWPNFPDALMRIVYDTYKKDPDRQAEEFKRLFKLYPNSIPIRTGHAVWLYQYNRFEEAFKEFEWVNAIKPHEDYFVYMAWCADRLGNQKEALKFFDRAQQINPLKWRECTDWICATVSKMPAWDERARMEIEKKAFAQHKDKIKLNDTFMEPPAPSKKDEPPKENKPDGDKKSPVIIPEIVGKEPKSDKQAGLQPPEKAN